MNIGALDRKITIQAATTVRSSTTGEATQSWTTFASVWATVTYPNESFASDEGNELGRETAITPVNFTVWFRNDLNEGMRILYDSQYYDIMRINKVGQRDEMLKIVTVKKY